MRDGRLLDTISVVATFESAYDYEDCQIFEFGKLGSCSSKRPSVEYITDCVCAVGRYACLFCLWRRCAPGTMQQCFRPSLWVPGSTMTSAMPALCMVRDIKQIPASSKWLVVFEYCQYRRFNTQHTFAEHFDDQPRFKLIKQFNKPANLHL
jgi:hypothetical protein